MLLPPITIDIIEALTALRPLALATIGIAVYGVFVFNFYRFLARKDIFKLDLDKYNHTTRPLVHKTFASFLYVLKFLIIFPAFVFFWFVVLAFLLSLMARNQSVDSVLLAAMAVVGSIRICAYYSQTLSTDLAKILPFALLGITLIDRSLVNIPTSSTNLEEAVEYWETMVYYMAAVVILEVIMRILAGVRAMVKRKMEEARGERSEGGAAPAPVSSSPAAVSPDAANGAAYGYGADGDDGVLIPDSPAPVRARVSPHEAAASRGGEFPPYRAPLLRDLSAGGGETASARRGRGGGMYSSAIGRPTFSGRVRISGEVTNVVRDAEATMPWERTAQWRAAQSSSAASAPDSDSNGGGGEPFASEDRAANRDRSFEKLTRALSYGRGGGESAEPAASAGAEKG